MRNNVFEIEAMLSIICLYQRCITFEISFDSDTLITKYLILSCPNPVIMWDILTMYDDLL